jgi:hypothetical protein
MDAGDLLILAKARIEPGHLGEWIEDHCKMSRRTAQVYMQLARHRAEIEAEMEIRSGLSIQKASEGVSRRRGCAW